MESAPALVRTTVRVRAVGRGGLEEGRSRGECRNGCVALCGARRFELPKAAGGGSPQRACSLLGYITTVMLITSNVGLSYYTDVIILLDE